MVWEARIESLSQGRMQKICIVADEAALSCCQAIELLGTDSRFRSFLVSVLADCSYRAYRWEMPPVTRNSADRDFEFVILESNGLVRQVDLAAFSSHFMEGDDVVTFPNLGGDATLVVPCPVSDVTVYGHLASFIRQAPRRQVHVLWQAVSHAMGDALGDRPIWLNTAGMGVAWLHIRLDTRPKYYGYAPYKKFP